MKIYSRSKINKGLAILGYQVYISDTRYYLRFRVKTSEQIKSIWTIKHIWKGFTAIRIESSRQSPIKMKTIWTKLWNVKGNQGKEWLRFGGLRGRQRGEVSGGGSTIKSKTGKRFCRWLCKRSRLLGRVNTVYIIFQWSTWGLLVRLQINTQRLSPKD